MQTRSSIVVLLLLLSGCVSYIHEGEDGSITKVVRFGLNSEIDAHKVHIPQVGADEINIKVRGGLPPEAYMEVIEEIQNALNKSGWGARRVLVPNEGR